MPLLLTLVATAWQMTGLVDQRRAAHPVSAVAPVGQAPEAGGGRLRQATANCIALDRVRSTQIISGTGIVYHMAGRTRFINRLRSGADRLAEGQIMLVRSPHRLLCSGDIVYLLDGLTGSTISFVGLGAFEQYAGEGGRTADSHGPITREAEVSPSQ